MNFLELFGAKTMVTRLHSVESGGSYVIAMFGSEKIRTGEKSEGKFGSQKNEDLAKRHLQQQTNVGLKTKSQKVPRIT